MAHLLGENGGEPEDTQLTPFELSGEPVRDAIEPPRTERSPLPPLIEGIIDLIPGGEVPTGEDMVPTESPETNGDSGPSFTILGDSVVITETEDFTSGVPSRATSPTSVETTCPSCAQRMEVDVTGTNGPNLPGERLTAESPTQMVGKVATGIVVGVLVLLIGTLIIERRG